MEETYFGCCANGPTAQLSAGIDKLRRLINRAKKAFVKAAEHLHHTGQFAYDVQPVKNLHRALNDTLQDAVHTGIVHEVPEAMLEKLRQNVFVFSGMKTYAQLKEAAGLLTTKDGLVKGFTEFKRDIEKLNIKHNERYLEAEYLQAVGTSQAVDKYLEFEKDGDDYHLQIRTAQDERVRQSHAALHNITLPFSDPFWNTHWTPFDWRCRCNIVQVRKGDHPATDSETATKAGQTAVPEMFRYNPAKAKVIFPPKHPYHAQHCGKKLNVSGNIELAQVVLNNERDKCDWQKKLKEDAIVSKKIKAYKNGGSIHQSPLVDKLSGDYKKVLQCCDHFAKEGHETEVLPKVLVNDPAYANFFKPLIGTKYEGKSPDFRVGNKFYELEGFTTGNPGKAIDNMMKRGFKQSSRLVIEDTGIGHQVIKKTIHYRKKGGVAIEEVWILKDDGSLAQVL